MNQLAIRTNTSTFNPDWAQRKSTSEKRDNAQTSRSLADLFRNHFETIPANTPEQQETVYQLRYQVYCQETGFEDPARFPDQLERDRFDEYSVHSLLRHQETGIYAGTVRLILPRTDLNKCFPIQDVATHPIFLDRKLLPWSKVSEVSRFALSKDLRKQLSESSVQRIAGEDQAHRDAEERRILPHIVLGLFTGMVRMSAENGIEHWFCVMEPALVRLLTRYGLHFMPYGPIVEYHGQRQPCYARIDDFLKKAYEERPDVWRLITDDGRLWSSPSVRNREAA